MRDDGDDESDEKDDLKPDTVQTLDKPDTLPTESSPNTDYNLSEDTILYIPETEFDSDATRLEVDSQKHTATLQDSTQIPKALTQTLTLLD